MTSEKKKVSSCKIVLSDQCRAILDSWRATLREKFPGIKISYSDLVRWSVTKVGATLSKKDLSNLRGTHFDEVRQLEWRLANAKAAKAKGESFPLDRPALETSKRSSPADDDKK